VRYLFWQDLGGAALTGSRRGWADLAAGLAEASLAAAVAVAAHHSASAHGNGHDNIPCPSHALTDRFQVWQALFAMGKKIVNDSLINIFIQIQTDPENGLSNNCTHILSNKKFVLSYRCWRSTLFRSGSKFSLWYRSGPGSGSYCMKLKSLVIYILPIHQWWWCWRRTFVPSEVVFVGSSIN
jgi:hypothetical protein